MEKVIATIIIILVLSGCSRRLRESESHTQVEHQFVHVFGQVKRRGPQLYHENMTVEQIFILAGGFGNHCGACANERAEKDIEKTDGRHPVLIYRGDEQIHVEESERKSVFIKPGDSVGFGHYEI